MPFTLMSKLYTYCMEYVLPRCPDVVAEGIILRVGIAHYIGLQTCVNLGTIK
jgi:hypothetical protein